jgi:Raf kinase inhibitor-like YbhB/YbcL family protein
MATPHLTLISPSFDHGELIPPRHTCEGADVSPRLKWMHTPEGTRTLALIVDDPDAPGGTFTHWVLFDIPADVEELPEGESGVGVAGRNDFQFEGYRGPCPPPNHPAHRYRFKLFALDVEALGLEDGASQEEVEGAIEGHILGQTELVGRFQRKPGASR